MDLIEMLILHEGLKKKPYRDTVGKLTIGVGRNLDDIGITVDESMVLLANDIREKRGELSYYLDFFEQLDQVRQEVLIDMCFMGIGNLLEFKKMLAALEVRDFEKAAEEMLESKWASQVKGRSIMLAGMMVTGKYPLNP